LYTGCRPCPAGAAPCHAVPAAAPPPALRLLAEADPAAAAVTAAAACGVFCDDYSISSLTASTAAAPAPPPAPYPKSTALPGGLVNTGPTEEEENAKVMRKSTTAMGH
jgi:hypothetical protein